ncbi:hypothetical protein ACNHYB_10865 [Isoptericola jiangsuensis]|uniref:hypothetical protein n=1 Tax=Isoptericola jiangsuensis TaxID=548579 RepID=UPI003AABD3B9
MCQPTTCRTCGRTTWTGCGMHVDDVRRAVPAAQWCDGHDEPARGGFLSRLLGGR